MAKRSDRATPSEVEIRAATEGDLDAVLALAGQTFEHHIAGDPHFFEPIEDPDERRAFLAGRLGDAAAVVLVAVVAGRVVGYAVVFEDATPAVPALRPRRVLRVDDLGVDAAHRREGIGRRLMDEVLARARDSGVDAVELNVFEFNAGAVALYESLGYETASRWMRLVVADEGSCPVVPRRGDRSARMYPEPP